MEKMKALLPIILITICFTRTYSQTTQQEAEKIATFCRVWGFLKYYHPTIAKGKLDWDKEFTSRIRMIATLNTKQETGKFYTEWITSLGTVEICKKCGQTIPDSLSFNLDLAWLSDTALFTNDLIKQLQNVRQNRSQEKNYYVQQDKFVGNTSYDNEKPYKDSIFPAVELRLLGLARYWNIINYFYPYKYKTDQPWPDVLTEMIAKFKDAPDTLAYHLAMMELTAKINDSHADFATKYTNQYFGLKWAPFRFKIIENKAIVTGFFNDSLCKKRDIQYGDIFLKVNGMDIEQILKEKSKYIGASNEATKLRNSSYAIFNGQTDSVAVTFERDGVIQKKYIDRYLFRDFKYVKPKTSGSDPGKILEGNIGYLDLGLLQPNQVDKAMKKLENTVAIIFDVRNYPYRTMYRIAETLNNDSRPFAKFATPDLSYPGVYHYQELLSCGKKNKTPYPGKVVLLFNETSQSHAEFALMALKTAPNVVCIGSQTAGADGNVSTIVFPGGYETRMTGIGVYYPDGRETQRVGIIPDIEVKPTLAGIRAGQDEVLERAIALMRRR